MAEKVLLRDKNNTVLMPITRGELILDSSGNTAFRSTEFLANASQPGLMSPEDKRKIENMQASSLANALTLKINNGSTEGTNLYTYNGSSIKTLDIVAGNNITLSTSAGRVVIDAITQNDTYTLDGFLSSDSYITRLTDSNGITTTATIPCVKGATTTTDGNAGLVPGPAIGDESKFLKGDGTWGTPADSHYTTHLYIGKQSSNNSDNNNSATTNGNTYLKLFDNNLLRHQYNIKGVGVSVVSDDDGNITIATASSSWDDIQGKPEKFTPEDHIHTSLDIRSLQGYTKSDSDNAIQVSDSLNAALGKLEYKADLGKLAYNWYQSVTVEDTDDIINKWGEIVDFIDSVKEGTDITDELVTRQTAQTITGAKTFSGGVTLNCGLNINGTNPITWNDGTYHQRIQTTDDTFANTAVFTFQQSSNTGSSWTDLFTIKDNGQAVANKFTTIGGTASQFVKGDGSLDSNTYLTSSDLTNYASTGAVTFTPANAQLTSADVLAKTGAWSMKKGTWSYAGNGYIQAGSFGNIDLAGCSVITLGASEANGYTQLYITGPTATEQNAKTNEIFFYNNHGEGYKPDWTRVITHRNYNEVLPVKLVNGLGYSDMISAGYLRSDYVSAGHPAEDYLKALCLQLINSYKGCVCIGSIRPSTGGSYICYVYDTTINTSTGLPEYMVGTAFMFNGIQVSFGTVSGAWYYRPTLTSANYTTYTLPRTQSMSFQHVTDKKYVNASFVDATLSKVAVEKYIEFWDGANTNAGFDGGYFNGVWGKLKAMSGYESQGKIALLGTTADTSWISFGRSGAAGNYITWPGNTDSACLLAFGYGNQYANSYYYMSSSAFYPANNNTRSLGTDTMKWSNVYATTFTGTLDGKASKIALNGINGDTAYGDYGGIIQSTSYGPTGSWHNSLKILHNNSAGYYTQLAQTFTGEEGLWHRRCTEGTVTSWKKVIDSDGGTLNKNLYFNHDAINYAQIVYKNTRIKADGGGWADPILTLSNNASEKVAGLGMYGSQDKLSYLYIGTGDYDKNNHLRIYPDKLGAMPIQPNETNLYDLGTSALRWNTLYTNRCNLVTKGLQWVGGKTLSNAAIEIATQQTTSAYFPIMAVKTSGNHVVNIGGLGDYVGFYGYYSSRTENGTDWEFQFNASNGSIISRSTSDFIRRGGNFVLENTSGGETPHLVFRRGTSTDSAVDFDIYSNSGYFYLRGGSTSLSTLLTITTSSISIPLPTTIGTSASNKNLTVYGTTSSIKLTLTQSTGTAPMTISSTTKVNNLNADMVDGKHASDFDIPVGTIVMWAGSTAPTNWLMCDGSAVSRTTYSTLFTVIGTTYGTGDGSTTFNLPNFKRRFPLGAQDGSFTAGSNAYFSTLGKTGGTMSYKLTVSEMPSHNHTATTTLNYSLGNYKSGGSIANSYNQTKGEAGTDLKATTTISNTGGGSAHNNMPPYLAVNFIVKYQ